MNIKQLTYTIVALLSLAFLDLFDHWSYADSQFTSDCLSPQDTTNPDGPQQDQADAINPPNTTLSPGDMSCAFGMSPATNNQCVTYCSGHPRPSAGRAEGANFTNLDSYCGAYQLDIVDMTFDSISIALSATVLFYCSRACFFPVVSAADADMCAISTMVADTYTLAAVASEATTAAQLEQPIYNEFFGNNAERTSFATGTAGLTLDTLTNYPHFIQKIYDAKTPDGAKKAVACISAALVGASLTSGMVDLWGFDVPSVEGTCQTIQQLRGNEGTPTPTPTPTTTQLERMKNWLSRLSQLYLGSTPAYCESTSNLGSSMNPRDMVSKVQAFASLTSHRGIVDQTRAFLNKETPVPPEFGPISKIINEMPNTSQLLSAMEADGVTLSSLVKDLRNDKSITELLSSRMTLDSDLKQLLQKLDAEVTKEVADAKRKGSPSLPPIAIQPNPTTPSALFQTMPKGGRANSNPGPLRNIASTLADIGGTVNSSDIWHESTNLNIFQIVSQRVSAHFKSLSQSKSQIQLQH